MRNHIALKFAAVLLAALTLLGALASAAGIVTLTVSNLYERTVDELHEEQMDSTRRHFAVNLVHRYASLHLGNIPEGYLDNYYGFIWQYDTFSPDCFCYVIRDQHGTVVESTLESRFQDAARYEISITDLRYRRLVPKDAEALSPHESQEETTATEAPLEASGETFHDSYYDYELDQVVEFEFEYADLPPYTVELYLLPGATSQEYLWTLLETVWNYRDSLFYILAGSLLLFAIFFVYLCCAAGKKPGQTQIRAGGLNCIPLDLYALCTGCVVTLVVLLAGEGLRYLLEESPGVLVHYAVAAAFACCLLIVGFCFAFAAQVKTPGGYWYRNSLLGRGLILFILLCKKLWHFSVHGLPRFFSGLWALVKKIAARLWAPIGRGLRRLGEKLARIYGLLPLTWQWLLTGAGMLVLAFLAFAARGSGWVLLCLLVYGVIVVYGACAFGILLEGAKKMRRGNLEGKVHHQMLIGSFRDFSEELNGLADVAMTAAQDKLKSERMKTELITNVSHDIKTPLTSIINYVDLMEKPHSPEEQAEYLDVLSRQSARLKKLIDDLMEMSKASTGNVSVEITQVDAAEAINQALGEFADKLDRASLIPVVRLPDTPVLMKADGKLLWRVLSNLLGNAVKYALPGTRLYIDLMELDGKAVISLKNISREELNVSAEELMERFVRGDTSRNTEGSGLGLNIAQSLMELQKGQLQLLVDGDLFKVTLTFPAVADCS